MPLIDAPFPTLEKIKHNEKEKIMKSIFTDQNGTNGKYYDVVQKQSNMEPKDMPDIRFYTYPEAAKILRCSEKTLYNRIRSGQITPLYNGRLVLFTKECLDEFLQRKSEPPVEHVELQPLMETGNPLCWRCFSSPSYVSDPIPVLQ